LKRIATIATGDKKKREHYLRVQHQKKPNPGKILIDVARISTKAHNTTPEARPFDPLCTVL
jgi:hypothetical protein